MPIFLITVIAKNEKAGLTANEQADAADLSFLLCVLRQVTINEL